MSEEADTPLQSGRFIARLILGLAQGIWLYALYRAADAHVWPATEPAAFAPQILTALYVPLLISQAMGTMRLRTLLIWAAVAAIATYGLGTYDRLRDPVSVITNDDDILPMFSLFFFGFAGLFIAQSLIAGGDAQRSYIAGYGAYFDAAWKLGVQLALSVVFVGVFWGVLWLGAVLFNLIKLDFLEKLIEHEWFSIPATALAVAAAIHLTDVRARLVAGIRGVILTLLGWLLPLMALIAAGFLVGLIFTGFAPLWQTKAAAGGLLAAAAALIILINAAYQNGEQDEARPALLRYAELVAAFALAPLILIAAYALSLRVAQYGWTVERIATLACIIAGLCYAIGYATAAVFSLMGRPWMQTLQPVNIGTAFVVIALLVALFTPIADPMNLSVDDQIARLRDGKVSAAKFDYAYLKNQTGRFGMRALEKLTKVKDKDISSRAKYALKPESAPAPPPPAPKDIAANVTVYPKGAKLPEAMLQQKWNAALTDGGVPTCLTSASGGHCDAILTDLNGDGVPEVIIVTVVGDPAYWYGSVMQAQPDGTWMVVGGLPSPHCPGDLDALRAGRFKVASAAAPPLGDIQIAGRPVIFAPVSRYVSPKCTH
jgi:hypothetical protein